MPTVYDFLSPDETEVEEQRIIRAPGATTGDVLTVQADKTVSPAPGGSQLKKVSLPIAFNTPNLVLTGVQVTTLNAGDILLAVGASYVSVSTAWDGTTPTLFLGIAAEDASIGGGSLTNTDTTHGGSTPPELINPVFADTNTFFNNAVFLCGTATPVIATVTDGSGGDPGSMVGAGEIVLFIYRA